MLTSPRGRSLHETRAKERHCGRALPMDGDEPGAMAPSGPRGSVPPDSMVLDLDPRAPSQIPVLSLQGCGPVLSYSSSWGQQPIIIQYPIP